MVQIGRWAFIVGLVLAVLAAYVTISNVALILFVLGLIAGFLNISEKESHTFLLAVVALILVGVAGVQSLGGVGEQIATILTNLMSFLTGAAVVVAVKQVLEAAKK